LTGRSRADLYEKSMLVWLICDWRFGGNPA
jgi:hypothetical protein